MKNNSMISYSNTLIKIAILIVILVFGKTVLNAFNISILSIAYAEPSIVETTKTDDLEKLKEEKINQISNKLSQITGKNVSNEINNVVDDVNAASQLETEELEKQMADGFESSLKRDLKGIEDIFNFDGSKDLSFSFNLGGK